ncbi:MAG: YegP family protein [Firmicutes bacterium]|nr:YegP family protein [Bacillota bacterium]
MGKYVIKETKTGFTFRLKAGNGEIIGVSEVYTALSSAKNGIASVAKNAPIAAVEDQTVEGFEKAKNPKFEIYTDKAGELRFRLKAANGEIILTSEGYSSMSGCKNGIESVRKNADSEAVMEEA